MNRAFLLACLSFPCLTARAQEAVVPDFLVGKWRICFVLDSSVTKSGRTSRMSCGTLSIARPRGNRPIYTRSGEDSVKLDAVLHFDHDLRFSAMLGEEPGTGPVGSGTLVSTQGQIRLYLNAARDQMAFDDHSIHALGHVSKGRTIAGTWEPSCFRPCAERGVFHMRRIS